MNQQGTETLQIASKFGQKTPKISNYKKLCEGIPFFEIGNFEINKQTRQENQAKQQIAISKIPRKTLKTNASGLDQAPRSIFFPG